MFYYSQLLYKSAVRKVAEISFLNKSYIPQRKASLYTVLSSYEIEKSRNQNIFTKDFSSIIK